MCTSGLDMVYMHRTLGGPATSAVGAITDQRLIAELVPRCAIKERLGQHGRLGQSAFFEARQFFPGIDGVSELVPFVGRAAP